MERATGPLTRNSADLGAQMDRVEARLARLEGRVDDVGHDLDGQKRALSDLSASADVRFEGLTGASKTALPQDADDVLRLATSKMASDDYVETRQLLRHFISTFSSDGRVMTAQILPGDSYFAEQKFAAAVVEYRKVIDRPEHKTVAPEVLYKIGQSFYHLKYCQDAELFLKSFLRQQPRHEKAASVRKLLGLVGKFRRSPGFCQP